MGGCYQITILCCIFTINALAVNIKPFRTLNENVLQPKHINSKRYTLNTANGNSTSVKNSKKTLIDITGSEFPDTNYQQQEFFFDTAHDFGEFDNEEMLQQSELKSGNEYGAMVGTGRSDLIGQQQNEMSSFNALTQESFDNDDLEAINQANEQAMEKYGSEPEDSYRYDEEVNSFYPTNQGWLLYLARSE